MLCVYLNLSVCLLLFVFFFTPIRLKMTKLNTIPQDDGIFEYIDSATTEVDRTTLLNQPDVVLGQEQTNNIHNSILRQFHKANAGKGDVSTTVRITGASGGDPRAPDGEDVETTHVDTTEAADGSDEELVMDPTPFANLFHRMHATSGSGQKRASSSLGAVAAAAGTVPKKPRQGPVPEPSVPTRGGGGGGGGGNTKREKTKRKEQPQPENSEKGKMLLFMITLRGVSVQKTKTVSMSF